MIAVFKYPFALLAILPRLIFEPNISIISIEPSARRPRKGQWCGLFLVQEVLSMGNGFFSSLVVVIATAGSALPAEPQPSVPATLPESATTSKLPTPAVTENSLPSGWTQESAPVSQIWVNAEFLQWWIKSGTTPPLVTSSTPGSSGIIGTPGTETLFGGGNLDYGERPGARFSIGTWFDTAGTIGFDASYFFLSGNPRGFNDSSSGATGSASLARPFFNVLTGSPSFETVSLPGYIPGSVRVSSNSDFQGAQANFLFNLCCSKNCCPTDACCPTDGCCPTPCCVPSGYRVDLIAGFRYLQLNEDLGISENLAFLPTVPPPFVPGSTIGVYDHFETRNNFYGGQIGARMEWWRGNFFVNVLGVVALGDTQQEVLVNGVTTFTSPTGAVIREPGGLLAQATNIGSRSRDELSFVPEVNFNVGYQFTSHWSAYVGYSFLYWSSVVRPGNQIDIGVNPTQIPSASGQGTLIGPARPAPLFNATNFWAQGINVGLQYRW